MSVIVRGWHAGAMWPRVTRTLVTPPMETPLSLEDVKGHSRIIVDTDDADLMGYLRAATRRVEGDTGTALMTQTWDLSFDGFPYGTAFDLPIAPVQSVTSVTTTDTNGTATVWAASNYYVSQGRIGLTDAAVWPTDLRTFAPVTIRVVAGYASASLIPEDLLQAVRLVFAWLNENREPLPFEDRVYEGWIGSYRRVLVA